jgi:hypothetical protein
MPLVIEMPVKSFQRTSGKEFQRHVETHDSDSYDSNATR